MGSEPVYSLSLSSIPPLVVGLAILALGGWTLIRERASQAGIAFGLWTLSVGIWLLAYAVSYSAIEEQVALRWAKLGYLGVPFIPTSTFLFAVVILRQYPAFRWFVWISSLVAGLFSGLIIYTDWLIPGMQRHWWGYYPRYGWLAVPFLTFFFGLMLASLWRLWVDYRQRPRRKVLLLLIAIGIAYLGSIDYLPKLGIPVYPCGYGPIFVFCIMIVYVLKRYHSIDLTPALAASQILATVSEPILVCNAEGIIRAMNPAGSAVFGYSESELQGQGLDRLEPVSSPELRKLLQSTRVRDHESVVLAKNGVLVDCLVSVTPVADVDEVIIGHVVVLRDIRERKRAEAALRRSVEELARSNQDLESFAYMASHDLQEPLRNIAGYLRLLQRRYQGRLEAEADEFITGAVESLHRMQRLIQDLLAYARVSTQGVGCAPVDINRIVQEARAHLQIAVKEAQAEVVCNSLPTVHADEGQLRQVFQNLLANALKFRRQDVTARIEIASSCQDGMWHITVRDNGIGIEPDQIPRLFGMFQRLHTQQEYPGTGIGLAVCKKIIERHGGTIGVESVPGQGASFWFTLPVCPEKRGTGRPAEPGPLPGRLMSGSKDGQATARQEERRPA